MRLIVPLLIAITPAQALHAQTFSGSSSEGLSYVFYSNGAVSSTGSGDISDFKLAHSHRAGKAPLLYVRDNGASYIIRDPAFLRRAQAIMRPQQELGQRQGALGRQQGVLGKRQGALGAEQGRIGRLMADSTARRMGDLGVQMAALGRRQTELGEQQAALGRQQAELGRQQARLAEVAQPKLRALVNEAIQRGAAQRVN